MFESIYTIDELESTIEAIEEVIAVSDELRYSYFWHNNGNQSSRRYRERELSAHAEWDEGCHHYDASISCYISRKHVYPSRKYFRDGEKTNLNAVHASLRRLKQMLETMKSIEG